LGIITEDFGLTDQLLRTVSQSQHLNDQNNVTLFKASKWKTIPAADRDQVHTQKMMKHFRHRCQRTWAYCN